MAGARERRGRTAGYNPPMIAGVTGWTDDELRRAALDAPRRAYRPFPGLEVLERPGWLQLVAPTFREGGLNGVWHADLADDEADAAIDRTIAFYAARGLRFRWLVDPETRPLDLGERLARRGLGGEACRSMLRATGLPLVDVARAADVTIERVDHASLPLFNQVSTAGWELDPAPFAAYHRVLLADPRPATLYLARWRGEPAATALQLPVGDVSYLIAGVVLPAHRGRGLYRALVAARLRDAAAAGLAVAVTLARASTSAPILERLGFSTVCEAITYGS
jgi:GNAT superfamily N-acetyltransferase